MLVEDTGCFGRAYHSKGRAYHSRVKGGHVEVGFVCWGQASLWLVSVIRVQVFAHCSVAYAMLLV